jgi:hypothetical protein
VTSTGSASVCELGACFVGFAVLIFLEGDFDPSLTGISTDTGLSGTTQWHNAVRARGYMKAVKPAEGEQPDNDLRVEGTEVFYNDVFDANEHRDSDTAVEARALFEFFKPGFSRVTFGAGTLIFNWEGKETVPTRSLFRTSWSFVKDKPAHQLSDDELKRITFRNIWYNFQDCSVQEIVQKALKARSSGADGGGKPVGET